jgi:proteasome lid subunit RPN8/RPN11
VLNKFKRVIDYSFQSLTGDFMTIRVKPAALKAIREHGQQSFPNECCGLLLGKVVAGVKELTEILPIANARETEAQRNRYLISAEERFRAERQARRQGLGVIGCYHSHPNAPARPSEFDREHAPFPVESFVIVAVKEGVAQELTSWVLSEDREMFHPEEIVTLAD